MKRNYNMAALAVAAVLGVTGCGAADPGSTTPTSGQGSGQSATAEDAAEHNDADVMFAQMMIPHHRQAVEMSEMMLAKDDVDPAVMELATEIRDAQAPEIETMTGWLESWDEPVEMSEGMDDHDMSDMGGSEGMDGMMSEDQMAELESATGDEASRLFLNHMTVHHEGAVEMAQQQIDNGLYPDAISLAETIVETQQAEIEEMNALLQEL